VDLILSAETLMKILPGQVAMIVVVIGSSIQLTHTATTMMMATIFEVW
jgi:hypothetical protein